MTIQVTGKNMETGDAFQAYVTDKTRTVLEKYIGPEISGHVRIEKVRGQFHTQCTMRLKTGLVLEAQGTGADAFASADTAIERLEKRVRRYKRRLKDHHHGNGHSAPRFFPATESVVQIEDEEGDLPPAGNEPIIVAETIREVQDLSVRQAVMQLDLTEQPFLVFRHASTGAINIVYRRDDGNVGWINSQAPTNE